MHSMSLFVELLRTRPRTLFWTMAVLQAALWTLVPALFFAAPPGQLPLVLAIGHEFQFGTEFGPPLAFWLAEIAYRLAGMPGVYFLSQVCIVATFGVVLALGRVIVGLPHAVMAVMLMAAIAVFSVPTPEFGPAILATPLWALILFHYWMAARQGRSIYWVALGVEAGLLLLTTYAGLVLIGLLVLYTVTSALGRAQIETVGPWIAGVAMTAVLFPYLIWLDLSASISFLDFATIVSNLHAWAWLTLTLLLSHTGMLILIVLGRGPLTASDSAAIVIRAPVDPAARRFVYFFALAPVMAMALFALFTRRPENFMAAPLVVMSGLAAIIAAGERIKIGHQYVIGYAWLALIVMPPLLVASAIVLQPWTFAADLRIGKPAAEMGHFFGDSFERRTGRSLAVVAGDQTLASLVALEAPSRPSLYLEAAPADRTHVTKQDIAEKGAVILWLATDNAGRPPPEILRQFPDLAIEVPRAFERQYQGRMPLMRVGWGMIRPRGQSTASEGPPVLPPRQVEPEPPPPPQPALQTPPAPRPQPLTPAPRPPQIQPQRAEPRPAQPEPQRDEPPRDMQQPEIIAPEVVRPPRRAPRPAPDLHRPQ
jgi:Dolichyl-phosphate-mannose-protein mannosyltransferase